MIRVQPIFYTFSFLCLAVVLFIAAGDVPDKASPFTAVKWEADQPIVRFEGDWYQFQSINGLSVSSIIEFCKETYENRWQKRFSEDFVEVLTKMGHKPDEKVDLVLSQNGTRYEKTGIMTEDNRDLVRDFNNGEDNLNESESGRRTETLRSSPTMSSQERMAQQMAEWIDTIWESEPPEDAANIKFLFRKDGTPFEGKIDIRGDFIFRAINSRRRTFQQAFNPNLNGRWIYEDLPPGTYNLSVTGLGDFDGWEWSRESVAIKANTAPLFEIDLDE